MIKHLMAYATLIIGLAVQTQAQMITTPLYPEEPITSKQLSVRQKVIELYFQGWNQLSISRFLCVSRPTINRWIERLERDNSASLGVIGCDRSLPKSLCGQLLILRAFGRF